MAKKQENVPRYGTAMRRGIQYYRTRIDPKTVQYLAGHENSKTTMDIYAQVKYNKPEELLSVVNAAFAPSVGV